MRPFRAVTASDDMTVNLHNGVPFKFARSIKDHTRFVYDVRYSPDGQVFASTGADGKIFLYNGDNGDRLSELSASADSHAGSIFSLCWSSDSRHLLSSSADCTAKLWDVTAGTVVQTWKLGSEVGDQQVGNWWRGDYMISVSLKGDINYLTRDSPTPSRVVMVSRSQKWIRSLVNGWTCLDLQGHQRPITALAASSSNTFVTGSSDGRVLQWSAANGTPTAVEGPGHSNQVTGIACSAPNIGIATSTGMDDTARFISLAKHSYGWVHSRILRQATTLPTRNSPNTISLDGVPRGIGTVGDLTAIVLANKVATVMQQTQKSIVDLTFSATCVAVRPDASEVAIGGEDNRVHIFRVGSDGKLEGTSKTLDGNRGAISTLVYSPDGSLLLAGDSQRKIVVYDAGSGAVKIDQWVFHNSRVNSAAFSPNGKYAVTGSLDTNLILWTVDDPFAKAQLKSKPSIVEFNLRVTYTRLCLSTRRPFGSCQLCGVPRRRNRCLWWTGRSAPNIQANVVVSLCPRAQ